VLDPGVSVAYQPGGHVQQPVAQGGRFGLGEESTGCARCLLPGYL
jgi:hypothetical protein